MQERIKFKIATSKVENEYEIQLPNVGQYRDVEVYKQMLSNGTYSMLVQSGTISSNNALDIIDIEATFKVLCPKLLEDLKCDLKELGIKDFAIIKAAYKKDVEPFMAAVENLMRG